MHIDEAFPGKYAKASDLKGREVTVTITAVEFENINAAGERKLVAYFRGKQKGLIINKTNANRIAFQHGPRTEDWIGKNIVLYTEFTDFQGKPVEAIRVKPTSKAKHVVTDRGSYDLSELEQQPPSEGTPLEDTF